MSKLIKEQSHKPKREGARGKELSDLKRENQALKRQVSRLQKIIRKYEDARGETIEVEEDVETPLIRVMVGEVIGKVRDRCPCGSTNLTRFTTPGGKILTSCKDCKTRL